MVESLDFWYKIILLEDSQLLKIVNINTTLGSGKGGQKRNKTKNAVRMNFDSIAVTSSKYREKHQNIKSALKKLRLKISLTKDIGQIKRIDDLEIISFLKEKYFKSYIQNKIIKINPENNYYPLLIGLMFDSFFYFEKNTKKVAELFDISHSQLNKLMMKDKMLVEVFFKDTK